jgi:polysaccharide export outer membrane protein
MEGPTVPIIYTVSFKDPGGYFLATKVQMRNKDIMYASNAQSVEISKFLQFIQVVINTGNEVGTTGITYQTFTHVH